MTFRLTLAASLGLTFALSAAPVPSDHPGVVLGRPTPTSIVASVRADAGTEVYFQFGAEAGAFAGQTLIERVPDGAAAVVAFEGLEPDSAYVYRARWRAPGESAFRTGPERAFHTTRRAGATFRFVVQADPHLDANSSPAVYERALANQLADRPDFMVDLGDTAMSDKCVIDGQAPCAAPRGYARDAVVARQLLMRGYFEQVAHSVPLFMALGNHDGEAGWLGAGAPDTLDAWSVLTRKAWYPNPEPDGYYTGNDDDLPEIGRRQNYYAFEWGDALVVVLDPYAWTMRKPNQDGWAWTLGQAQYAWLARTLAASEAPFTFVFVHHLLGGGDKDARGGAAFANRFEWGGRNADGTAGFDARRPGWDAPVHDLLARRRATLVLHGHDHLYAREQLDGVVYQEVPQPSLARYDTPDPGAGYGYLAMPGVDLFPSSGHLRITVGPAEATVEYIRAVAAGQETATRRNGAVVHRYSVAR